MIRNDPLLHLKQESKGTLWATFKQLCLHEFSGDYDHYNMILAQRQMFMITTFFNMILQVLLIGYQIFSFVFTFAFDDSVKN